ncbi:MAG: glycosyltransferase family 2 protein [Desulfuromonadaceae bacterium]|nr:glycosyltransferase family 2 protein [Desulfuromonadaceae bacterium]MDD2849537.1 glycosyltransferase family 2 protein [Desulfuromonadaceae bacterium]MDD4131963.1 glycosyltransferase family 2 protein [Desulfuromonadaceae bacterium]
MLNILIPLGGQSSFFNVDEYPYPKPLIEINGRLMIELLIESFASLKELHRFIFIVQQADCQKYHLDETLKLLTEGTCEIVMLGGETKGAACSALMAIDHIDNCDKLIISNGDQLLKVDMDDMLACFSGLHSDGGVVCFKSVHPKWSYVRLDVSNNIIEAAEKRPISNNAIAGVYYFKHGADFVKSAMRSIEKDANVDGFYFISPTLNEMVLENKQLDIFRVENDRYHSFYSPQKIKEYEMLVSRHGMPNERR